MSFAECCHGQPEAWPQSLVAAAAASLARVSTWIAANRDTPTYHSRNTASHCHWYLARDAFGASRHTCLTYLAAFRVWHFASTGLLDHAAAGVRNSLRDT